MGFFFIYYLIHKDFPSFVLYIYIIWDNYPQFRIDVYKSKYGKLSRGILFTFDAHFTIFVTP